MNNFCEKSKFIFQYYSDVFLNLNYSNKNYIEISPIKKENYKTILILSGNIGQITSERYWQLIRDVGKKFYKVFIIPGEIEVQGFSLTYINELFNSKLNIYKLSNIHYLSDSIFFIKGYKIIGGIQANKFILNELNENRIPCIVITNKEPDFSYDIDINIYKKCCYWFYGKNGKNHNIDKLYTNQFGKDWYKPLENFNYNSSIFT